MKNIFILILLTISFTNSYAQSESLYALCDDSLLLKIESKEKEFKILKHEFRNEKLREEFTKKYNLKKVPYQSFYLTFVYYKKPINLSNISKLKLTFIDDISCNKVDIGHRTKIFFIVKTKCDSYDLYETTMNFEE